MIEALENKTIPVRIKLPEGQMAIVHLKISKEILKNIIIKNIYFNFLFLINSFMFYSLYVIITYTTTIS